MSQQRLITKRQRCMISSTSLKDWKKVLFKENLDENYEVLTAELPAAPPAAFP